MKKLISLLSLFAGLLLPIILMIVFRSPSSSQTMILALGAIVTGWVCNIVWASTTTFSFSDGDHTNTRSIATKFGWICPSVIVLATFLVQSMLRS